MAWVKFLPVAWVIILPGTMTLLSILFIMSDRGITGNGEGKIVLRLHHDKTTRSRETLGYITSNDYSDNDSALNNGPDKLTQRWIMTRVRVKETISRNRDK